MQEYKINITSLPRILLNVEEIDALHSTLEDEFDGLNTVLVGWDEDVQEVEIVLWLNENNMASALSLALNVARDALASTAYLFGRTPPFALVRDVKAEVCDPDEGEPDPLVDYLNSIPVLEDEPDLNCFNGS